MDKSELSEAAYEGDLARIKKLIAKGALLSGADGELYTGDTEGCITGNPYYRPLSEAARAGQTEAVKALLTAGAQINEVNHRDETALMLAAQAGHLEGVKELLTSGADPHHVGYLGNALAYCHISEGQKSMAMLQLLVTAGVSPDVKDNCNEKSGIERLIRTAKGVAEVDGVNALATIREAFQLLEPHTKLYKGEILTFINEMSKRIAK